MRSSVILRRNSLVTTVTYGQWRSTDIITTRPCNVHHVTDVSRAHCDLDDHVIVPVVNSIYSTSAIPQDYNIIYLF